MAKRKQIGIFSAAAIAMATALGGAHQANALTPTTENVRHQENKEGLHVEKKVVKPESERNKHGGFSGIKNPYKTYRTDGRSQRQWRKWLRSNPSMRKSKYAQK